MKILFLSGWGCAVPLAMQCEDAGHEVKFFIKDEPKDVGDGFVEKVDVYKEYINWADLIVCDCLGWGNDVESIVSKGKPVIGANRIVDSLEDDRSAGQKLFKASGMNILESKEFKDIDEAILYVTENPKRYVVKVSGSAQNDKSTTYVGQSDDGFDVPSVLEHMKTKMSGKVSSVDIQEHVEGIEIAVGGFFNGKEFMNPVCINFEHKKLMSGPTSSGIGPNTSEMGTTHLWLKKGFPLYEKTIGLMVGALKKMNYHGYYDINCIIKDNEIYPLEATCRFGWPLLSLQIETIKNQDLGEFLLSMASGSLDSFHISNPYSTCVVIGVPPLPYSSDEIFEKFSKGMPILFKDPDSIDSIYPCEVILEDDQWFIGGSEGCSLVCTGQGEELGDSIEMAYSAVDNVILPNKMYRDDIGRTTQDIVDHLREEGLI